MTFTHPSFACCALAAVYFISSPFTTNAAQKKNTAIAASNSAVCAGSNMLDALARTDPLRYQKISKAAATIKNADAILWRVNKPGVPSSYLFGTVHLTDPRVTKLSPRVKEAFSKTTTLALEVADLSPTAMARAISRAAKLAIYPNGDTLKTILSPDDLAKVERKLKSSGMPVETARMFRPWVITILLSSSDCERQRVKSGKQILDMMLADLAKTQGSAVVGLETLDEQLQALASVPPKDQLVILQASLAYVDQSNDLVETLIQLYLSERLLPHGHSKSHLPKRQAFHTPHIENFRES